MEKPDQFQAADITVTDGVTALPIDAYRVFESADLDAARSFVTGVFCDHQLAASSEQRAPTSMCHYPLADIELCRLSYGREVTISPVIPEDFYLIQFPLTGHIVISDGKDQRYSDSHSGNILPAVEPAQMVWSEDCDCFNLKVHRPALERVFRMLTGQEIDEPLRFDLGLAPTGRERSILWSTAWSLMLSVEQDQAAQVPQPVHKILEQSFMTALLYSQPSNYWPALHGRVSPAIPRHIKQAEDYIRAHAGEAITIEDLVTVTGVSARSLFSGFKSFRGCSPMRYLRNYRLDKVKRDLEAAGPGETVTSIAMRWGFTQLGRFAAAFKERHGSHPSDLLRHGHG